ncbi:hypothetical protein NYP18_10230 [Corynebacterium sp. YIM 101645]|uniref:ABC transporter permease n=1 Tax=Corynebacterium lemuris TaxID=1859292 RepID=A0ABT2FXR9_9CORY|nr:hypothetical protein [Corynebacterium lemuris]MCS5480030.1 hypothetical protein [Corynebacterium lemuris]
MIRLNFRLRRNFLIIWSVCLWAFLAIFPPAYENYYPTPADRTAFLTGIQQNAGMTAVWGPLETPASLGQIVMWEAGSLLSILASVMSVLMMVGLHRKEEHQGQMELRLSTGINRMAPAAAALLTTAVTSLVVGAGSGVVLAVSGLYVDEMPLQGAVVAGATFALVMFGSALLAQLVLLFVDNPAALTRVGLVTIAASVIVRATADSQRIEWLNWLSPLGWKTLVRPFVHDDWAAVAAIAAMCLLGSAAALFAERHREYGQALFRLPVLPRRRVRRVRGPVHLSMVLNRGTIVAWTLVVAALAAFFIAITGSLSEWMEAEENIGQIFKNIFDTGDMKTEFITYVAKLCGILVATMGIQAIVTYRSGEIDRTVDLQRSTGIRRWVPLGSAALIGWTAVLSGTTATMVGGVYGLWSQDSTTAGDYDNLLLAAWSQLGPALLLTAVAVALVGLFPRFAHFAWAPVITAAVLTLFGPILNAPQWLIDLSPFEYGVTVESGSWAVHLGMGVVAVVLTGWGLVGARQREIY